METRRTDIDAPEEKEEKSDQERRRELSGRFVDAVSAYNLPLVRTLLPQNPDFEHKDYTNFTAYDYASRHEIIWLCVYIEAQRVSQLPKHLEHLHQHLQSIAPNRTLSELGDFVGRLSAIAKQLEETIVLLFLDIRSGTFEQTPRDYHLNCQTRVAIAAEETVELCLTINSLIQIYQNASDMAAFKIQFQQLLAERENALQGERLDICYLNTAGNQLCFALVRELFPEITSPANLLLQQTLTKGRQTPWFDAVMQTDQLPTDPQAYFRTATNQVHLYADVTAKAIAALLDCEEKSEKIWVSTDPQSRDQPLTHADIQIIRNRTPTLNTLVNYTEAIKLDANETAPLSLVQTLRQFREEMKFGDASYHGKELEAHDEGYSAVANIADWWHSLAPPDEKAAEEKKPQPFAPRSEIQNKLVAVCNGKLGNTLKTLLDWGSDYETLFKGHTRLVLLPDATLPVDLDEHSIYVTPPQGELAEARYLHKETNVLTQKSLAKRLFDNTGVEATFPTAGNPPLVVIFSYAPDFVNRVVSACESTVPRSSTAFCLRICGGDLESVYTSDQGIRELNAIEKTIVRTVSQDTLKQWQVNIVKELEMPSAGLYYHNGNFGKQAYTLCSSAKNLTAVTYSLLHVYQSLMRHYDEQTGTLEALTNAILALPAESQHMVGLLPQKLIHYLCWDALNTDNVKLAIILAESAGNAISITNIHRHLTKEGTYTDNTFEFALGDYARLILTPREHSSFIKQEDIDSNWAFVESLLRQLKKSTWHAQRNEIVERALVNGPDTLLTWFIEQNVAFTDKHIIRACGKRRRVFIDSQVLAKNKSLNLESIVTDDLTPRALAIIQHCVNNALAPNATEDQLSPVHSLGHALPRVIGKLIDDAIHEMMKTFHTYESIVFTYPLFAFSKVMNAYFTPWHIIPEIAEHSLIIANRQALLQNVKWILKTIEEDSADTLDPHAHKMSAVAFAAGNKLCRLLTGDTVIFTSAEKAEFLPRYRSPTLKFSKIPADQPVSLFTMAATWFLKEEAEPRAEMYGRFFNGHRRVSDQEQKEEKGLIQEDYFKLNQVL